MTVRRLVLRIAGTCHVNAWHMTLGEMFEALHVARELTQEQNPAAVNPEDAERATLPWLMPDGRGGWQSNPHWHDGDEDDP